MGECFRARQFLRRGTAAAFAHQDTESMGSTSWRKPDADIPKSEDPHSFRREGAIGFPQGRHLGFRVRSAAEGLRF